MEIGIDPILGSIGSFSLAWHGLMTALAIVAAVVVVVLLARWMGVAAEAMYSTAFWAILGGIIGSRVVHVIDQWELYYPDNLWGILRIWDGGLSLYGAILGGLVAGVLYTRLRGLPTGRIADCTAFGLLSAQIIGRIGCFINGDAYGTPTSLPWGVIYTHPDAATTTILGPPPRHPVPLYEIAWDLVVLATLWQLRWRVKRNWLIFVPYLCLYSFGRFFLSFMRGDEQAVLFGLHQAQVISLLVLVVGIPLIIYLLRRPVAEAVEAEVGDETSPPDD